MDEERRDTEKKLINEGKMRTEKKTWQKKGWKKNKQKQKKIEWYKKNLIGNRRRLIILIGDEVKLNFIFKKLKFNWK